MVIMLRIANKKERKKTDTLAHPRGANVFQWDTSYEPVSTVRLTERGCGKAFPTSPSKPGGFAIFPYKGEARFLFFYNKNPAYGVIGRICCFRKIL